MLIHNQIPDVQAKKKTPKKPQEAAAILLAALAIVSHCLDDSCCASTLKTMNIFLLSLGRG